MVERQGVFYQRREQTGFDGKPGNREEKRVDYVMGSGHHARTFLHRTESNRIVELPLAWYSERGGEWAMNPGYDRPDHQGFRRVISSGCMFCHNGYPMNGDQLDADEPRFPEVPEGIDCQRCHGPGGNHVRMAQEAKPDAAMVRAAIVNPARLTAERQLEVCMQCHLETTSFPLPNTIRRFERGAFSYVAGEPLGSFALYFDHAPGKGRDDKFEIVNAVYRLRQSACFRKSDGKLLCTTCHDPHGKSKRDPVEVCRKCHEQALARLPATHPAKMGCVECHMPRRRTEDVVHAAVTDHAIPRRQRLRDALAPREERHESGDSGYRGEVVLYYPALKDGSDNELYLALAQAIQKSNLAAGVRQLENAIAKHDPARGEWMLHLGDAWRNLGDSSKAIAAYEAALRKDPQLHEARLQLGAALRQNKQLDRAIVVLSEATRNRPNSAKAWYESGMAFLVQRQLNEAIGSFQRALSCDRDMAEAHNSLGGALLTLGDGARAETAFREAVRIRPDYAEAHNNLAGLLMAKADLAQACFHYEAALRAQPAYKDAHYNYALALARLRRFDNAMEHARKVVAADPQYAEGQQLLGGILSAMGQARQAIPHYREALRMNPGFGRARIGLAMALAAAGDQPGARQELERASQSPDPATRRQALELLSR